MCQTELVSSALESLQVSPQRIPCSHCLNIFWNLNDFWLFLLLSSATRSQTVDDAYKKDYKFLISEKENVPAKRDTEMLILAKDSGKQFTSSSSVHIGGGESDTDRPLLDEHWIFSHLEMKFLHSSQLWSIDSILTILISGFWEALSCELPVSSLSSSPVVILIPHFYFQQKNPQMT